MKKSTVEKALLNIGISTGRKGFKYIVDSVLLLDTDEFENGNVTDVYQRVAEMNNTKADRVERCIRSAIEKAKNYMDRDFADHYFGKAERTNKNAITMLHKVLKNECESRIPSSIKSDMPESIDSLREMIRHEIRMFFYNEFTGDK